MSLHADLGSAIPPQAIKVERFKHIREENRPERTDCEFCTSRPIINERS